MRAFGCRLPAEPLCPAAIPAPVGRSSKRCRNTARQHHRLVQGPKPSPSCPTERRRGTPRRDPTCHFQLRNSSGHQMPRLLRSHVDLASWSIYGCSPSRRKGASLSRQISVRRLLQLSLLQGRPCVDLGCFSQNYLLKKQFGEKLR